MVERPMRQTWLEVRPCKGDRLLHRCRHSVCTLGVLDMPRVAFSTNMLHHLRLSGGGLVSLRDGPLLVRGVAVQGRTRQCRLALALDLGHARLVA